eukprot:TRINITY_DN17302_c0_g2_i1.p1 TRINITY_DN17302_c0_g2~~TRINITY_DN17302_c0_g2_i1.p1  ORF type:complete len:105 (-),score=2.20 TRINITY_DN17302_c0_g2_i1:19-333(-)
MCVALGRLRYRVLFEVALLLGCPRSGWAYMFEWKIDEGLSDVESERMQRERRCGWGWADSRNDERGSGRGAAVSTCRVAEARLASPVPFYVYTDRDLLNGKPLM